MALAAAWVSSAGFYLVPDYRLCALSAWLQLFLNAS